MAEDTECVSMAPILLKLTKKRSLKLCFHKKIKRCLLDLVVGSAFLYLALSGETCSETVKCFHWSTADDIMHFGRWLHGRKHLCGVFFKLWSSTGNPGTYHCTVRVPPECLCEYARRETSLLPSIRTLFTFTVLHFFSFITSNCSSGENKSFVFLFGIAVKQPGWIICSAHRLDKSWSVLNNAMLDVSDVAS